MQGVQGTCSFPVDSRHQCETGTLVCLPSVITWMRGRASRHRSRSHRTAPSCCSEVLASHLAPSTSILLIPSTLLIAMPRSFILSLLAVEVFPNLVGPFSFALFH